MVNVSGFVHHPGSVATTRLSSPRPHANGGHSCFQGNRRLSLARDHSLPTPGFEHTLLGNEIVVFIASELFYTSTSCQRQTAMPRILSINMKILTQARSIRLPLHAAWKKLVMASSICKLISTFLYSVEICLSLTLSSNSGNPYRFPH